MFATLYIVTSLLFVASVGAYSYFCTQLAQDIKEGRVPVKVEAVKK